jgi:hypothetical protein
VKTDDELKKVAEDIFAGRIFTDRHIKPEDQKALLHTIFLPLVFMADEGVKKMRDAKIDVLYEYLDKAGPRMINGYPCFFSMSFLNEEEAKKVFELVEKIRAAVKGVSSGDTGGG